MHCYADHGNPVCVTPNVGDGAGTLYDPDLIQKMIVGVDGQVITQHRDGKWYWGSSSQNTLTYMPGTTYTAKASQLLQPAGDKTVSNDFLSFIGIIACVAIMAGVVATIVSHWSDTFELHKLKTRVSDLDTNIATLIQDLGLRVDELEEKLPPTEK